MQSPSPEKEEPLQWPVWGPIRSEKMSLRVKADSTFGSLKVPSNLKCMITMNKCRNNLYLFSQCNFEHCYIPSLETELFNVRFLQFKVFVLQYAHCFIKGDRPLVSQYISLMLTNSWIGFWCSQLTQARNMVI